MPTASPTFLVSPRKGAFIWKQRPDSHRSCHPDSQPGHTCGHCRQATWICGPALPPTPRSFLSLPVLSFPICKLGLSKGEPTISITPCFSPGDRSEPPLSDAFPQPLRPSLLQQPPTTSGSPGSPIRDPTNHIRISCQLANNYTGKLVPNLEQ